MTALKNDETVKTENIEKKEKTGKAGKIKKKGSLFWKIFAVWLVVLAAVCIGVLIYGYNVMMDYDNSQKFPYEETVRIASLIESGNYDMLYDRENLPNSMTLERDEYERRIKEAIEKNGGCDVMRAFSPNAVENPTFLISAGDRKIATVVYEKVSEKTKFGFDVYRYLSLTPFYEGSYAVELLVPEDCDFVLNGDVIGDNFRVGEPVVTTAEEDDFEKSGEQKAYYYRVDGLMVEPEFKIVYRDTGRDADMIWDGKLEVWTTRKYDVAAVAPSNYRVFVNGSEISSGERFVTKKSGTIDEVSDVKQYLDTDVCMVSYHVSGLRYKNEIEVTYEDFDGRRFTPEFDEYEEEYVAYAGITPEHLEKYGINFEFLFKRALSYAKFVNDDDNENFDKTEIKKYCLPDSRAYVNFQSLWITFTSHNSFWTENEKLADITFYHEDFFVATVEFDYWIKGFNHQTDNTKVLENSITFWYVRIDGTWYIVDFALNKTEDAK